MSRRYVIPGSSPGPARSSSPVQPLAATFPWDPSLAPPSAFPPYFRPVFSTFPANKDTALQLRGPIGLVVTPAAVTGAPVVDCATMMQCPKCSAFLCPDGSSWCCPFCTPVSTSSVIDFVAPDSPPFARIYLFIVDTSRRSFDVGLAPEMITSIKATVPSLPDDVRVGLMSMSAAVAIFDLRARSRIVLSDLTDTHVHLKLASICPPLRDCKHEFLAALDALTHDNNEAGNCIGNALEVVDRLLSGTGGLVFLGCAELPANGPYSLRPRTSPKASDSEMLCLPADGSGKFYRNVAWALSRSFTSVHLFAVGPDFLDLSTLVVPSGLTGGSVQFYPQFAPGCLHSDLFRRVTATYEWGATLSVRVSPGVRLVKSYSNSTLSKGHSIVLGNMEKTAGVGVELAVDEPVPSGIICQLVYATKVRGARIFTFALPVSDDARAVIASIDELAFATLMTRKAVVTVLGQGWQTGSQAVARVAAEFLGAGRRFHCLHALLHGLLCARLLAGVPSYDWFMAEVISVRVLNVVENTLYLYPRIVRIPEKEAVALAAAGLAGGEAFIVHCWNRVIVWLADSEEAVCDRLADVIEECWRISGRWLPVEVIVRGDLRELLVDDSVACGVNLGDWIRQLQSFVI